MDEFGKVRFESNWYDSCECCGDAEDKQLLNQKIRTRLKRNLRKQVKQLESEPENG